MPILQSMDERYLVILSKLGAKSGLSVTQGTEELEQKKPFVWETEGGQFVLRGANVS